MGTQSVVFQVINCKHEELENEYIMKLSINLDEIVDEISILKKLRKVQK